MTGQYPQIRPDTRDRSAVQNPEPKAFVPIKKRVNRDLTRH